MIMITSVVTTGRAAFVFSGEIEASEIKYKSELRATAERILLRWSSLSSGLIPTALEAGSWKSSRLTLELSLSFRRACDL